MQIHKISYGPKSFLGQGGKNQATRKGLFAHGRITKVKFVFAVGNNTFAVKSDGSFWGWGTGDRNAWPFQVNTKVPTAIDLK